MSARPLPQDLAYDLFSALVERHKGRPYHSWEHVARVVQVARRLLSAGGQTTEDTDVVCIAAFYHDAVYETGANDNEWRSAEVAASDLERCCARGIGEVERLILLTQHHRTSENDFRGQALIDADLEIFAAPATEYDAYAQAIRREYHWVTDEAYAKGRASVLQAFLDRPRIFFSPQLDEARARANLRRELSRLESP